MIDMDSDLVGYPGHTGSVSSVMVHDCNTCGRTPNNVGPILISYLSIPVISNNKTGDESELNGMTYIDLFTDNTTCYRQVINK